MQIDCRVRTRQESPLPMPSQSNPPRPPQESVALNGVPPENGKIVR